MEAIIARYHDDAKLHNSAGPSRIKFRGPRRGVYHDKASRIWYDEQHWTCAAQWGSVSGKLLQLVDPGGQVAPQVVAFNMKISPAKEFDLCGLSVSFLNQTLVNRSMILYPQPSQSTQDSGLLDIVRLRFEDPVFESRRIQSRYSLGIDEAFYLLILFQSIKRKEFFWTLESDSKYLVGEAHCWTEDEYGCLLPQACWKFDLKQRVVELHYS